MWLEHNNHINLINKYLKEFIFLGLFYFKNKLGKITTISINSNFFFFLIINKLNKMNKLEREGKKKTFTQIDNCDNVILKEKIWL